MASVPEKPFDWTSLAWPLLVAMCWGVFWRVLTFEFCNFDDDLYVFENNHVRDGLTLASIKWAWITGYIANWHPLTWLSLMLDSEIYGGLRPGGFHATNLILHTANTLLLYAFFVRLTKAPWKSFFVAALFAIHPLHVEGVAWISERKDLLSALFGFSAMIAWLRFTEARRRSTYVFVLATYACSLMSKQMLVTLPFLLLVLDFWPLKRLDLGWKKLVVEKAPLLFLAILFSGIAFYCQNRTGTVGSLSSFPLWVRIANAVAVYGIYFRKTFWPSDLGVFYPHPGSSISMTQVAVGAALLVLVTALALWQARRRPYVLVGWLWYLGTLVPVIGIVQIGWQQMADRYTYIPIVGLFFAVVWLADDLLSRLPSRQATLGALGAATLTVAAITSYIQCGHWQNSVTLFAQCVKATGDNYLAECNLGASLARSGRLEDGIAHLKRSIELNKNFATARMALGIVLFDNNRVEEARKYFEEAYALDSKSPKIQTNLGVTMYITGDKVAGLGHLRLATEQSPMNIEAWNNLGMAYLKEKDYEKSLAAYQKAVNLDPRDPEHLDNAGFVLLQMGRRNEAIEHFRRALAINPNFASARNNLAAAQNG